MKYPSLFELLSSESFRKRTPMYISDWKISSLKCFMDGYFYASMVLGHETQEDNAFGEFNDWVANYFEWRESTAGWKHIILKECNDDEEIALKMFFELYDKFKNR